MAPRLRLIAFGSAAQTLPVAAGARSARFSTSIAGSGVSLPARLASRCSSAARERASLARVSAAMLSTGRPRHDDQRPAMPRRGAGAPYRIVSQSC
jgi:hypothetical protein